MSKIIIEVDDTINGPLSSKAPGIITEALTAVGVYVLNVAVEPDHQDIEVDTWKDSWSGRTITVGDVVEHWSRARPDSGKVSRIYQARKRTRWLIELEEDRDRDVKPKRYASDYTRRSKP